MRLAYYAGASTAAAAACLLKAFHQRPNFYSATVYLSQSNACLLILTNLLLVLACSFMYALQRLLYGPLRPIEIEQLSEKAWYAVLDTLLAMPSFREDVGGWLLAMFTLLLAGKVWGWIGEGRVDVLEQQPPANPRLFHMRLATSLFASVAFDLWMLDYCVETVMADPRPGMMVIFTFEFAILTVFSSFTLARYFLALIQTRVEKQQMVKAIEDRKAEIKAERTAARQGDATSTAPEEPIEVDENELDLPGWEEKRRYLFALEVFTDFIKLLIYIVFFTVSITFNGLPMHIMRDVYMTFASFSKRVADYVAYRKATSDMNARYPDATTEEIRGDACIVCREIMVAWEPTPAAPQQQAAQAGQQPTPPAAPARRRDEGLRAKKLPCGHILHLRCLKSWLERQQVCPTCRRPVVVPTTTTTTGRPGAPGAVQNGGQARHPAQRQGRARILNLGPIRIGFLNGPGDQINNLVRQMQNLNQPNAQAHPAAQDPNQQGPNHLGLQVPYANNTQQPTTQIAHWNNVPTQTQFMLMEQRIMREAQTLGVEQQQLYYLRLLEAELARLRQWHAYRPENQPHGRPSGPQLGPPIVQSVQHYPPAQTLHGAPDQQFGNGHESLPEGMVLPEGWTVMPLRRSGLEALIQGAGTQQIPAPSIPQGTAAGNAAPAVPGEQHHGSNTQRGTGPTGANGDTSLNRQSQTQAGPTDERGSPLFVPREPQQQTSTAATTADPSAAFSQPPTTAQQDLPPPRTDPQSESKAPWNSEGWSFVEPPNGNSAAPTESATAPQQDGSYESKGKGKAAEVEDAPDEGT